MSEIPFLFRPLELRGPNVGGRGRHDGLLRPTRREAVAEARDDVRIAERLLDDGADEAVDPTLVVELHLRLRRVDVHVDVPRIERELAQRVLPKAFAELTVERAWFGNRAGVLGALALARSRSGKAGV